MRFIFLSILFFTFSHTVFSQINVSTGLTPTDYVQNLLGSGVTVSNVSYIGYTGQSNGTAHSDANGNYEWNFPIHQIGSFTNGNASDLGLNEGIILSSGHVVDAQNSASFFANSYTSSTPNIDTDLAILSGGNSYDISILEFDFVADGPYISFEYVFASEEYPNWVGDNFNDAFGFFLSGPGISGPYTNNAINIATLPNSTTPITINNVNNGYGDCQPFWGAGGNNPPNGPCNNCEYYVNNCGGALAYGGYTTVLTAEAEVQCGETYHIKLAIGDIGDANWDSAIFLKKNSLTSSVMEVTASANNICAGESVTITAELSEGTDQNGTFSWEPGGQTGSSITVNPSSTTEYTVTYSMDNCDATDTITIIVEDCNDCNLPTLTNNELGTCTEETVDLNEVLGDWGTEIVTTFHNSQADAENGANPINNIVSSSGTYWIRIENTDEEDCWAVYLINVVISEMNFTTSLTHPTCGNNDGQIEITVSGGSNPFSYSIDNGDNFQNENIFSDLEVGTYIIIVNDSEGCSATDTINLINEDGPSVEITNYTHPSCHNECDGTIEISINGGQEPYTVAWINLNGDEISNSQSGVSGLCEDIYTVIVTDNNNCSSSANVSIVNPPAIDPSFNLDDFCEGESNGATNIATPGGVFGFAENVNDGATINPATGEIYNGVAGTSYTVLYEVGGDCMTSSTQTVFVNEIPTASFQASDYYAEPETEISFTNTSSGGNNYSWDFDDGNYSSLEDPTHIYENSGFYNVTLTVTSNNGCSINLTIIYRN